MQQIIKRLELILTSIALEDEEIIRLQISKIKSLEHNADIENILVKLTQNDYSGATSAIECFIRKNMGLVEYIDNEVQGLKLELKILERKLQELNEVKNEYISDIDDFNREYSIRLGSVIQIILSLREKILYQKVIVKEQAFQSKKELFEEAKEDYKSSKQKSEILENDLGKLDELSEEYDELYDEYQKLKEELKDKESKLNEKRKEAKQAKEELDDDPASQEYHEAKEDTESFDKEFKEVIAEDVYVLDKAQLKELKKAFRRASRLCHPDTVSDELKEQAHHIMTELNLARRKKDLAKVNEILLSLQSGTRFNVSSDTINDKDLLKTKIDSTKNIIEKLEAEIGDILLSEDFQTITEIDDRDEYFDEINSQLEDEKDRLEAELKQLNDVGNTKPNPGDDQVGTDDYWTDEF